MVPFVSSERTNSTNDISTAYVGSTASGNNLQKEIPSSCSLLANQSSCPQLDHEDLEQLNEFDLEEIDLKWQVAMISMRLKKFYKKSGRKIHFDATEPVFDLDAQQRMRKEDFALMSFRTSKTEIKFNESLLDDKTDVLTYHKKFLAEAIKEKDELKPSLKIGKTLQKNLGKLLNTQMCANDKFGLGYGDHRYGSILSYKNEVLQSVFMNEESDVENKPLYDRFVSVEGMHVVPPPMTGNYMPSGPDIEIDYSKFTYGPKQSETSESNESNSLTSEYTTCDSDSSNSTPKVVSEPMPKPAVIEHKVVSQPKVWTDDPIIEEYESDSDEDYVSTPLKE
ncbi:hypothetical protein Tco_1506086 [Tanacetum coccineum]